MSHSSTVPRSLSDLVRALRKHVALLDDFSLKAFHERNSNYLGEIATKLRLLVWEGGRSNTPLLLKLMSVFEIDIPITLGGPPVEPPPGQPGPGDQVSLQEYLRLPAGYIRTPSQGLVKVSKIELIRTITEQDGGVHEDWSHDEVYAKMRGFNVVLGGLPAVAAELKVTTQTVLHVAKEFLDSLTPNLITTKNAQRKLSYANQRRASDPANFRARQLRGEALATLGRYEEALVEFEKVIAADPSDVVTVNARGLTLLRLERLPEAITSFERAINLNDSFADAHYNLACAYALSGNFSGTLAQLQRTKEIDAFGSTDPSSDPDLEKIRNDPKYAQEFRDLVKEATED